MSFIASLKPRMSRFSFRVMAMTRQQLNRNTPKIKIAFFINAASASLEILMVSAARSRAN